MTYGYMQFQIKHGMTQIVIMCIKYLYLIGNYWYWIDLLANDNENNILMLTNY